MMTLNTARKPTILITLPLVLATSLTACKNDSNSVAQATITTEISDANNLSQDTDQPQTVKNKNIMLYFPQLVEDLPYLLHPIVPKTTGNKDSKSLAKDSYDEYQPVFSENMPYDFSTHVNNLIFENTETDIIHKLIAHNNFMVENMFYPNVDTGKPSQVTIAKDEAGNEIMIKKPNSDTDTKKDFKTFNRIIYQVNETPNSKPENLSNNKNSNLHKQLSLYISNIDGSGFSKLHPDDQYFKMDKWMPRLERYYFETKSDSDNNGIIDEKDDTHHYLIDFSKTNPTVIKYHFE